MFASRDLSPIPTKSSPNTRSRRRSLKSRRNKPASTSATQSLKEQRPTSSRAGFPISRSNPESCPRRSALAKWAHTKEASWNVRFSPPLSADFSVYCARRAGFCRFCAQFARRSAVSPEGEWRLLDPVTYENISAPRRQFQSQDTSAFLTLEKDSRPARSPSPSKAHRSCSARAMAASSTSRRHYRASVNQLVLINRSKRPLLLLAGELVSGGKQDRVIGKDRIVPSRASASS